MCNTSLAKQLLRSGLTENPAFRSIADIGIHSKIIAESGIKDITIPNTESAANYIYIQQFAPNTLYLFPVGNLSDNQYCIIELVITQARVDFPRIYFETGAIAAETGHTLIGAAANYVKTHRILLDKDDFNAINAKIAVRGATSNVTLSMVGRKITL